MHPEQANRRSNERSMPKSDSQIAAKGKHRQQKPTKYCQKTNNNNKKRQTHDNKNAKQNDKKLQKNGKHMTKKRQKK